MSLRPTPRGIGLLLLLGLLVLFLAPWIVDACASPTPTVIAGCVVQVVRAPCPPPSVAPSVCLPTTVESLAALSLLSVSLFLLLLDRTSRSTDAPSGGSPRAPRRLGAVVALWAAAFLGTAWVAVGVLPAGATLPAAIALEAAVVLEAVVSVVAARRWIVGAARTYTATGPPRGRPW